MEQVFIRVNESVSFADAVAHLESLGYRNGWTDGFVPPVVSTATISGDYCGVIGWCKNPFWNEENGYQEIFLPTTKHKHYDLIVKWAADTSQKVWCNAGSHWFLAKTPNWFRDTEYHIGEHPPKRKIMIGDIEIDAPEVSELAHNTEYYLPNIGALEMYSESRWYKDNVDLFRLKTGVIHLNKEAAIAHAKALIKVSGGCVDE